MAKKRGRNGVPTSVSVAAESFTGTLIFPLVVAVVSLFTNLLALGWVGP